MSELLTQKNSTDIKPKAHPWRRCPIGMHFVRGLAKFRKFYGILQSE